MSQTNVQIQAAIKRLLKKEGYQQKHLAKALGVSMPTVKRLLNGDDFAVSRLDAVARFFGMTTFELLELSRSRHAEAHAFTEAQETFLAKSLLHLQIFRSFLRGYNAGQIRTKYKLSPAQLEKVVLGLDKAGLLEVWPEERLKHKAKWPFRWIDSGPLSRTYMEPLLRKIFSHSFSRSGFTGKPRASTNTFRPFELALRPESYAELCKELEAVLEKFRTVSKLEMLTHPPESLLDITGLLTLDHFTAWDEL